MKCASLHLGRQSKTWMFLFWFDWIQVVVSEVCLNCILCPVVAEPTNNLGSDRIGWRESRFSDAGRQDLVQPERPCVTPSGATRRLFLYGKLKIYAPTQYRADSRHCLQLNKPSRLLTLINQPWWLSSSNLLNFMQFHFPTKTVPFYKTRNSNHCFV